jgi:hypothetical protein
VLANIATENMTRAKANDTSSASRSSFFFRRGGFFAIEKMTKRETKGSGLTARCARNCPNICWAVAAHAGKAEHARQEPVASA